MILPPTFVSWVHEWRKMLKLSKFFLNWQLFCILGSFKMQFYLHTLQLAGATLGVQSTWWKGPCSVTASWHSEERPGSARTVWGRLAATRAEEAAWEGTWLIPVSWRGLLASSPCRSTLPTAFQGGSHQQHCSSTRSYPATVQPLHLGLVQPGGGKKIIQHFQSRFSDMKTPWPARPWAENWENLGDEGKNVGRNLQQVRAMFQKR